jgi:hypothetical protein
MSKMKLEIKYYKIKEAVHENGRTYTELSQERLASNGSGN